MKSADVKFAWRWVQWLLGSAVLMLAAVVLWHQFQRMSAAQLHEAWTRTPAAALVGCVLLTATSFACLAWYEWFATRCVLPGRVRCRDALRTGVASHAIANTLGFHALTAGALRYHLYRRYDIGLADVARMLALVALCVAAGVVGVSLAAVSWLRAGDGRWWQAAFLAVAFVVLAMASHAVWTRRRPDAGVQVPMRVASCMLLVSWLEMAATIGALYVLLPSTAMLPPAQFVLVFVGAMLLGIVSHAPGGVGVFEAAVLATSPRGETAGVLVALLLYRLLYNVLPFLLGVAWLVFDAWWRRDAAPSVRGRI
jgi:glycosyltransferase 2 family protein